ncbi:MAG: pilus assembly protein PilY, partial [Gammaproteobacteria bacterium]
MLSTFSSHTQMRAFLYSLLLCLTGGLSQPAGAAFDPVNDDTDIFLANPNIPADRPNVLLYVDNTANWNQPFDNEKAALVNVVNSLDDSYNVGLMLFPETGNPNDNTDGGYVRFAIRQMTTTNKTVLANNIINTFDRLNDTGNNNTLSLGMVEVYRYYAGIAERAGNVKVKTDYANNTNYKACTSCSVTSHPATAANLGGYALNSNANGALYNSPIDPTGCSSNYLIYVSNGLANENAAALAIAESELSTAGYDTDQIIQISGADGQEGNWMDEWAKFLATADINGNGTGTPHVYTYTLEVNPVITGGGPDMTALMQSVAHNGKGQYFSASDANGGAEIEAVLKSIFSQIQAVNSVFAAVTLPVSVNVRGTNLNQVYIGVFRPDANKKPRWFGNLKMYQLGFNTTTNELFLADVNGNNTENPTTGFIIPTAISFWTQSSNFWNFRPLNELGAGGISDLEDGDLVEKGGAAQQLRTIYETSQAARELYTCTTGGLTYPDCGEGSSLSA